MSENQNVMASRMSPFPTPEPPGVLTPGPLRLLAWLAITSIVAYMLVGLVGAATVFSRLDAIETALGQPGSAGSETLDGFLISTAVLGAVAFLAWVCAAGFFIAWLYRARVNLDEAGVVGFTRRRGWLIGVWFIPVANLVMPYWIVAEIAEASDHRSRWWRPAGQAKSGRGLLVGWWLTFAGALVVDSLGQVVTDNAVQHAVTAEQIAGAYPTIAVMTGAGIALWLSATVLVIRVILRVTRHQHDWTAADAVRAAGASPQPAAQP